MGLAGLLIPKGAPFATPSPQALDAFAGNAALRDSAAKSAELRARLESCRRQAKVAAELAKVGLELLGEAASVEQRERLGKLGEA